MRTAIRTAIRNIPLLYALAALCMVNSRWERSSLARRIMLAIKLYRQRKAGLPETIAFEPCCACTLDCAFCVLRDLQVHKHRRKTHMSLAEFKKIIDDIAWFTTEIQFSGGEPFIHKDICEMLAYARKKGIYTLVASNATLLTMGDNLDRLISNPPDKLLLSFEALDKETYESIRLRGNYEKLLSNIKQLVRASRASGNRYPIITLQMVLTKKNMHQEGAFRQAVADLGADFASVKALGVWPEGSDEYRKLMVDEYIVPISEHPISRHEVDGNGEIVCFRKPGQCSAIEHSYIGSGGEILPCWYIVSRTEVMGNAVDSNFVDVWNSAKYRAYRHEMLHGWANPLCHRCIGVSSPKVQHATGGAA